jgi:hypothetical protein
LVPYIENSINIIAPGKGISTKLKNSVFIRLFG